jgi:hypothetical protein
VTAEEYRAVGRLSAKESTCPNVGQLQVLGAACAYSALASRSRQSLQLLFMLADVELAGDGGGDEGGAVFAEEIVCAAAAMRSVAWSR